MTTDPTITIAGLRATIEREYYREQARTMAGEIVELQAERRGHAAERQSLTAERDALAAQLAEVRAELDRAPKVCAIHGVSLAVEADAFNRIDTERADAVSELARTCRDLASERAHLAACQTRIAGLEQAANERSAEVARLTARVAELEARPVLTVERLAEALDAHGHAALARKVFAHLGPVTLPSPDRAEELARADYDWLNSAGDFDRCRPELQQRYTAAMRAALAKLSPAPAREAAPTLVAVSDEELVAAYYGNNAMPLDEDERAGIRAVRAKLGAAEVTEERLAAAFSVAENMTLPGARRTAANVLNRLRATAAKELTRG